MTRRRVLFVFLDGVGLGDDDPSRNAFAVARLPTLADLLEGRLATRSTAPRATARATLIGLDASLGHDGLPQSGTGQSALLTGCNTVALHGRHFGPWVPTGLRRLVREQSVLARARDAGCDVAFANAYPEELVARALAGDEGARLPRFLRAGPPLAALGAGVLTRGTTHLEAGDALTSEITNEAWRERLGRRTLPRISAADAGRNLARIAERHDLTLYAHYGTDYAGHERDLGAAVAALELVDGFLAGVLAGLGDALLVVASDHGNLEDARVGHTRNPALGLFVGNGHAAGAEGVHGLADVTPGVLRALGVRP